MYMNTMIALAANTPGAEGSLFEWAWFIFNKYSTLFLKATWVTLYVALIGTLLGFILGFAVGIINTVKIHKEDNIVKKILLHILKAGVVFVIFYGIFAISVLKKKELRTGFLAQIRTFFSGTLGWKTLLLRLIDTVKNIGTVSLKWLNRKTKGKKVKWKRFGGK